MRSPFYLLFLILSLALRLVGAVELNVWRDESVLGFEGKRWKSSVRWGAYVELNGIPTEGQIIQLAKDAHKEMREQTDEPRYPRVMAAFSANRGVWLSSSANGPPLIYEYPTPDSGESTGAMYETVPESLKAALNTCRTSIIGRDRWETQHKFGAQCGELYALYSFLQEHPDGLEQMGQGEAKVVAWEHNPVTDQGSVKRPCGNPDTTFSFGCYDVFETPLFKEKITVIEKQPPEAYGNMITRCEQRDLFCSTGGDDYGDDYDAKK